MSHTIPSSSTPVLLILFNRPEKVRQLIQALSLIKPKYVYVAADGPRTHSATDDQRCKDVKDLISDLPWECDVYTHFQPSNLGCKIGVSTAISWFFEHVSAGIILEDDCIPTLSFFTYSTELLEKYQDDERIMHISGSSFIERNDMLNKNDSYYFSNIALVWGWATWRRAWSKFDIEMKDVDGLNKTLQSSNAFKTRRFRHFWISLFNHVNRKEVDTWDAQWIYSILKAGSISIMPAQNLIKNVGFGEDATHTLETVQFARDTHEIEFPLVHPTSLEVDTSADEKTMSVAYVNTLRKNIIFHLRSLLNI
jgi:hypothetical protein